MTKTRDSNPNGKIDLKEKNSREENRIYKILMNERNGIDRFINTGDNLSKLGPGDRTYASFAFDIVDFAKGTYKFTR